MRSPTFLEKRRGGVSGLARDHGRETLWIRFGGLENFSNEAGARRRKVILKGGGGLELHSRYTASNQMVEIGILMPNGGFVELRRFPLAFKRGIKRELALIHHRRGIQSQNISGHDGHRFAAAGIDVASALSDGQIGQFEIVEIVVWDLDPAKEALHLRSRLSGNRLAKGIRRRSRRTERNNLPDRRRREIGEIQRRLFHHLLRWSDA